MGGIEVVSACITYTAFVSFTGSVVHTPAFVLPDWLVGWQEWVKEYWPDDVNISYKYNDDDENNDYDNNNNTITIIIMIIIKIIIIFNNI